MGDFCVLLIFIIKEKQKKKKKSKWEKCTRKEVSELAS